MIPEIWRYRARPVRVIDGDTIDVEIDLGFGIQLGMGDVPTRLRLLGVDAPELRRGTPDERVRGALARDWVAAWLASSMDAGREGGWPLVVEIEKSSDSFGRWLAKVWRADGAELCNDLIESGHAEVWS